MFSTTEIRKPKAENRSKTNLGATLGHYISTAENRKPKAESRKPIESEPRGHSGDHYSVREKQPWFLQMFLQNAVSELVMLSLSPSRNFWRDLPVTSAEKGWKWVDLLQICSLNCFVVFDSLRSVYWSCLSSTVHSFPHGLRLVISSDAPCTLNGFNGMCSFNFANNAMLGSVPWNQWVPCTPGLSRACLASFLPWPEAKSLH